MGKDLLVKLERETLLQLAPEQLVDMIVEQAIAIEKLNSRILELEEKVEELKVSRDKDVQNIIETTIGRYPQKNREQTAG